MKLFGKDFSPQELALGAAANAVFFAVFPNYIAAPVCIASSLLWMAGGTFWKPLRRFGVPLIALWGATSMIRLETHPWYALAAILGIAWLHQGDGFPDHRPTTQDEGSWLGRWVEKRIPAPEIGGPATKVLACLIYVAITFLYLI